MANLSSEPLYSEASVAPGDVRQRIPDVRQRILGMRQRIRRVR